MWGNSMNIPIPANYPGSSDSLLYPDTHYEHIQEQEQLRAIYQQLTIDLKQCEIIKTIAYIVHSSMDISEISHALTEALSTSFSPIAIYIHIAQPEHRRLKLLQYSSLAQHISIPLMQYIPYDDPYWLSQAYQQHEPIIGKNLSQAYSQYTAETDTQTPVPDSHTYISVPLWFNNYFEGTLTLALVYPLTDIEVQTLISCGNHIASALAHTRLYTEVERERTWLRTILDQLPEGVLIIDANECIRYINTAGAHIAQLPIERTINIQAKDHLQASNVTTSQGQPTHYHDFPAIQALSGQTIHNSEGIVQRADGSSYYNQGSAAPLYAEDGTITGAVAIFRDITEQKLVEQHKSDFLSFASHELRTPITAIQGFAELLQIHMQQGELLDTSRSMRALTGIIRHSQHLAHLIEDVLDLSQIENDHFCIEATRHDLVPILTQVVETYKLNARQHEIHIILDGLRATDTLPANVDNNRLIQILNNLLNNAVKYSPEGGDIEVGIRRETPDQKGIEHCLIWVKDHGIGIETHELPHIFERFHRAHTLNRSIKGLGIGLYLVRELVVRHQGRIWAESHPGQGSTFYVQLPLYQQPI